MLDVIKSCATWIKNCVDFLYRNMIVYFGNMIADCVTKLLKRLKNTVSRIYNQVFNIAYKVGKYIYRQIIYKALQKLEQFMNSIYNWAQCVMMEHVMNVIVGVQNYILTSMTHFFSIISNNVMKIYTIIGNAVKKIKNDILIPLTTHIIRAVKSSINLLCNKITFIVNKVSQAYQFVTTIISTVKNEIVRMSNIMLDQFSAHANKMINVFVEAWKIVVRRMKQLYHSIIDWLTESIRFLSTTIGDIVNVVVNAASKVLNRAIVVCNRIVTELLDHCYTIIQKVTRVLKVALDYVTTLWHKILKPLVEQITILAHKATSFFKFLHAQWVRFGAVIIRVVNYAAVWMLDNVIKPMHSICKTIVDYVMPLVNLIKQSFEYCSIRIISIVNKISDAIGVIWNNFSQWLQYIIDNLNFEIIVKEIMLIMFTMIIELFTKMYDMLEMLYRDILECNVSKINVYYCTQGSHCDEFEVGIYRATLMHIVEDCAIGDRYNNKDDLAALITNDRLLFNQEKNQRLKEILNDVKILKQRRRKFFAPLLKPLKLLRLKKRKRGGSKVAERNNNYYSGINDDDSINVNHRKKRRGRLTMRKIKDGLLKFDEKFRDKVIFKPKDLLFNLWLRNNDKNKKCNVKIFLDIDGKNKYGKMQRKKYCLANYRLNERSSYTIAISKSTIQPYLVQKDDINKDKKQEKQYKQRVRLSVYFYPQNVAKTKEIERNQGSNLQATQLQDKNDENDSNDDVGSGATSVPSVGGIGARYIAVESRKRARTQFVVYC